MPDPNVPHATEVAQNPKHAQEPQDNDDNNHHVKDSLDIWLHRDVGVNGPEYDPYYNQNNDKLQ